MKKKIMKRYRSRVGNRETVCITMTMIPQMIGNEKHNWRRLFYRGWSDKDLKKLFKLLYMSGGHRWIGKDGSLIKK